MLAVLKHMAENYSRLKPLDFEGVLNLTIQGDKFHILLGKDSVDVQEGHQEERMLDFFMDQDTFGKLCDGTWSGLTAGGREHMGQSTPLDFKLPPGVAPTPQLLQVIYHMGMHFFNTSYPNIYRFGPDHTRFVHGGHATPLVYGHGVRFAYYTIVSGEQINELDDTNPFPSYFTIIGGKGTAIVADKEINIEKGMAIHVPKNANHVFKADKGQRLELMMLAYGPGA